LKHNNNLPFPPKVSLNFDNKLEKSKLFLGLELINKKIAIDYQKLLEENNKLMMKNEELLNQISEKEESVRLSEDEETTEATNTNTKAKEPPKVSFGRTGSLFEEIVSLRNIENLDCIDENFNEEGAFGAFSSKKNSGMKNRNLSLDYNPSFLTCFSTNQEENKKPSPNFLSEVDNHKIYEDKKKKANNAYEDFFLLTCQSVKLNFKYMDDILDVDIRPFFKEVVESRVPFHKVFYYFFIFFGGGGGGGGEFFFF